MVNVPKAGKIVDKVLSKADVLGALAGFYTYNGSFDNIIGNIAGVMTAPKPTNFPNFVANVQGIALSQLPLIIGGMAIEYLDVPMANKYAHAVMKFGVGNIMGGALASFIANSHNPGPLTASNAATMQPASSDVWVQKTAVQPVTTNAMLSKYTVSSPVMLPCK